MLTNNTANEYRIKKELGETAVLTPVANIPAINVQNESNASMHLDLKVNGVKTGIMSAKTKACTKNES